MSKQSDRNQKRKWIRAAQSGQEIHCEAASIDWIKAAADGDKPTAKRFSMLAYTGGPMQVRYYESPVVLDLSGIAAKAPLPILLNHDVQQLVGHADEVTVGDTNIKLAGLVSGASDQARQVVESSALGFPWKVSVGARPDKMEFVGEGITTKVNGKTLTGPLYVARKSTLGEVSFVAMAADGKATAKVAAIAANTRKDNDMEFDKWVEALGFNAAELTEQQQAALQAKYNAEVKAAAKKPAIEGKAPAVELPTFDLSGIILAYEKHVADVQASAAGYVGKIDAAKLGTIQANAGKVAAEMKAKALNEEWAATRLEVELVKAAANVRVALIDAERPVGPAIHASTRDIDMPAIEAGLCMASGLRDLEKHFKPEALESGERFVRANGGSLQSLILAAAVDNGYSGAHRIHRGNYDAVMRAAFIQAAASTHTLTTLLTTVGNKFLLQGFSSVEQVYREFSAVRSVSDFKQITSYRMLDDMVFEEVGPDGEIKHGTASQETFTNQAKTYAKMFALTRPDIINDDLGAFDTIRNRIGRGSGIKLNQIFWTSFLDDSVFFNATAIAAGGHANLITTVLGEAGIAAANLALKSQTDGYGNPIDIGGQHILLTGATLNPTARKWYVSAELRDTTASTKTPNTNIYQNQFRPIESRYITSTITWYLLPTGGTEMEPMEVCYLDGVQSPTIESADADFNTLGIQFRGYFDFGVNRKEWRASVKSTGAG